MLHQSRTSATNTMETVTPPKFSLLTFVFVVPGHRRRSARPTEGGISSRKREGDFIWCPHTCEVQLNKIMLPQSFTQSYMVCSLKYVEMNQHFVSLHPPVWNLKAKHPEEFSEEPTGSLDTLQMIIIVSEMQSQNSLQNFRLTKLTHVTCYTNKMWTVGKVRDSCWWRTNSSLTSHCHPSIYFHIIYGFHPILI